MYRDCKTKKKQKIKFIYNYHKKPNGAGFYLASNTLLTFKLPLRVLTSMPAHPIETHLAHIYSNLSLCNNHGLHHTPFRLLVKNVRLF